MPQEPMVNVNCLLYNLLLYYLIVCFCFIDYYCFTVRFKLLFIFCFCLSIDNLVGIKTVPTVVICPSPGWGRGGGGAVRWCGR